MNLTGRCFLSTHSGIHLNNMAFKIYTKTGDQGQTGLLGGTKVPKSHIRIETYGTVDELNSYLGLVGDLLQDTAGKQSLKIVQDRLFAMGSHLARDPEKDTGIQLPDLTEEDVRFLEEQIDAMEESLPPMKNFILPGGHIAVSTAHVARCVCRRAERHCVNMQENGLPVEAVVLQYLNRLSDYLFVLARYTAHLLQVPEVVWKGRG